MESGVVTVTEEVQPDVTTTATPTPTRKAKTKSNKSLMMRVLIQAFSMTFLAEWGDRSQLTTIILAARDNVYGVIVGGIIGHSLCTGLAVIGGRMIAQRISVRTGNYFIPSQLTLFVFTVSFFNSFCFCFILSFRNSDHCGWNCFHLLCVQRILHQPK